MDIEKHRVYGKGKPEYDDKFVPIQDEEGTIRFFDCMFANTLEVGEEYATFRDNTGGICHVGKMKVEW